MTFPFPFISTGMQKPGPFTFGWDDEPRVSSSWTDGALDFSDCAIGPPNPFRWVIVAAVLRANQVISDILINGAPAEIVTNYRNTGGSPDTNAAIARLLVPNGATCDVKIQTASATSQSGGICVYTAMGGDQAIHYSNSGSSTMTGTGPAQPNAIVYTHLRNGNIDTPLGVSGATETANVVCGTGRMTSGYMSSASGGTFTRGTNTDAAAAIAIFR